MTGDEFRARVLAALDEPASPAEEREHAVQCADDYARIYLARIDAIVSDDQEDRMTTPDHAAAVRAIHAPRRQTDVEAHASIEYCSEDRQDWPCATELAIRTADADAGCVCSYSWNNQRSNPVGCPIHGAPEGF